MKPHDPRSSHPPERPFWIQKWMNRTGYPEDYRDEFWKGYGYAFKTKGEHDAAKWARRELFWELLPKLAKPTAGALTTISTIVVLILKWNQ